LLDAGPQAAHTSVKCDLAVKRRPPVEAFVGWAAKRVQGGALIIDQSRRDGGLSALG
jgi:hypothetical protein